MKLIYLLVQELPKRGGWPEGAVECCRHYGTNSIDFYDETGNWDDDCYLKYGKDFAKDCIYEETSESHHLQSISRSEYESALAASQKPAWNGEGVQPVGCECECEISFSGKSLGQCEVLFVGDSLIVWKQKSSQQEGSGYHRHMNIRPLRTEAERKRDAAAEAIDWYMPEFIPDTPNDYYHAKKIYDAIAAGKIPGVKLED